MSLLKELPTPNKDKKGWPWTEETNPNIYDNSVDWPKISIVTPSYNQGKFIEETIRSILLQNYPNLEYIIIDGGSTDETIDIVKKYDKWITYWVSELDRGQSHAINKGIEKCTGDIFNWINSDDFLLPQALFYIASYSWGNNVAALIGRGHKINFKGSRIYSPFPHKVNTEKLIDWNNNNFMQPACFFKRSVFDKVGKLDENIFGCFDVDLWIRISRKFKFDILNKDIAHAYIHENAKTVGSSEKVKIETYLLMVKYGRFDIASKYAFELVEELANYKKKYFEIENKKIFVRLRKVKAMLKNIIKKVLRKL